MEDSEYVLFLSSQIFVSFLHSSPQDPGASQVSCSPVQRCYSSSTQGYSPSSVVRTNGLRLMRPEKSWRPIITVEVDKHHSHETTLGVDGQNPNLKEKFYL